MSRPEFFVTPGYGDRQRKLFGYAQAVRVGDRVEISGQGGWNDAYEFPDSIVDEITRAFDNIERTLATAGAGWAHVIHVNSYHVGLADNRKQILATMTECFRRHMPDHEPIWTCLGVESLAEPQMRVEIRVTAVIFDTGPSDG